MNRSKGKAFLSLLIVAIICGTIWRLEVEYHGWKGFKWLKYFHYSVPVCYAIYIAWVNLQIRFQTRHRLVFNAIAAVIAVATYYILNLSEGNSTPVDDDSGGKLLNDFQTKWKVIKYAVYVIPGVFALLMSFLLKICGQQVHRGYWLFSLVGMVLSGPASKWILQMTSHSGMDTLMVAVKSGVLFTIWAFLLGLQVIGVRDSEEVEIAEVVE